MTILAAVLIIAVIAVGVAVVLFVAKRPEAGVTAGMIAIFIALLARPIEIAWDHAFGTTSPDTGTTSPAPPPSPSATSSVPPGRDDPTTSAAPSTPPTDAGSPTGGPAPSFQVQMGTNTYADLDNGETNTSGGKRYEIKLDLLARLFHRSGPNDQTNTFLSQYRIVAGDDTDAAKCGHSGRLVNRGFISSSDLRDNNLCVSTSEGRWAILELKNIAGTSIFSVEGGTFDVYLSK